MNKRIHYIVGILFLCFALVQWNDPDFYIWIPPYLLVSYIAFRAGRDEYYYFASIALSVVFFVWLSMYWPSISEWYSDGMPSIIDNMKAETPYVELVRESLGLLLCLFTSVIYIFIAKKNVL